MTKFGTFLTKEKERIKSYSNIDHHLINLLLKNQQKESR